MSKKVKKGTSDASYSVGNLYEKLSSFKPSTVAIVLGGIIVAILLIGGTIFSLTSNSAGTIGYYNSKFIWFYPDLSGQYISENIISAFMYAIGFTGLFAVYQSTKNAYKPRQAYMLLMVGITLMFLSYIVLEYGLYVKINHIYN
ncbi:MAG: hypothetical protein NWF01_01330 [Candidatus Bathyarchaeota archaeon]|nr:hypothetical protein [Candidatus Bathyarchaeota archaeon]